jgi:hypothetical protein
MRQNVIVEHLDKTIFLAYRAPVPWAAYKPHGWCRPRRFLWWRWETWYDAAECRPVDS